ncbi:MULTISPECIES: rhodanese-like domain-containing protein [Pseudomonas]|uniref:Sulfurtransferase n=1 Tax=Pseudomonas neustonica TaxID=2487346 RepID=A0ABX9XR16_9PSED|nr:MULTISPECIES: rhodanese-like domain-containing protein [Pseudomonas]MBA6419708.1 sulfurtransferase [Pseudomonas sp. 5Ae-yellow]ROZ87303.1 sulfurtransferase [Pseudomonas sp. SSM44]ROZ88545.1 sulfurtransferase [Pseudomonas neustonica]
MTMNTLPLLLEPTDLELPKDQRHCRLVDLCSTEQYQQGHIPGAVHLAPTRIASPAPVPGLLPTRDVLQGLFAELGHHDQLHYIVYDDEGGGWAGRFIWLLDSIGHTHYSYINGGLKAWQQSGLALEQQANHASPSQPDITLNSDHTVDIQNVKNNLQNPDRIIWDARSAQEYRGEKVVAAKGGHIPGAINFEWTAGMDPERGLRLREDLAQHLQTLGISADKEIVTHCQTHHRSGFTYLAAKLLGYPNVKAYAGSWAEWGNHPETPIEL